MAISCQNYSLTATYNWSPSTGLNDPNIANPIAMVSSTTTYSVAVTDSGCTIMDSVTIVVDKKSLVYIDGTEMDFVKEGLNEGFAFNNPNEKDACGCGESFTV